MWWINFDFEPFVLEWEWIKTRHKLYGHPLCCICWNWHTQLLSQKVRIIRIVRHFPSWSLLHIDWLLSILRLVLIGCIMKRWEAFMPLQKVCNKSINHLLIAPTSTKLILRFWFGPLCPFVHIYHGTDNHHPCLILRSPHGFSQSNSWKFQIALTFLEDLSPPVLLVPL